MEPIEFKGKVDFGIITIREDELAAVLKRFPDQLGVISGQRQYNIRELVTRTGGVYTLAIVRCAGPGNGEAQQVANALLEDLAPRWLLVVGIAGGAPAFEFTLGDVVASTEVCDFNVGAVLKDGSREYALQVARTHPEVRKYIANIGAIQDQLGPWNTVESIGSSRPEIELSPKALYGDPEWQEKVKQSLDHHFVGPARGPKIVTGAIACSDDVMKDAELFQVWLKIARQVIAVENGVCRRSTSCARTPDACTVDSQRKRHRGTHEKSRLDRICLPIGGGVYTRIPEERTLCTEVERGSSNRATY